jgi:hypothetical protein
MGIRRFAVQVSLEESFFHGDIDVQKGYSVNRRVGSELDGRMKVVDVINENI